MSLETLSFKFVSDKLMVHILDESVVTTEQLVHGQEYCS